MLHNKGSYIIGFSAAVCGVCSIIVSTAAVSLQDRQEANALLDRQKKVLTVAGLMEPGEKLKRQEVQERFAKNITAKVVNIDEGTIDESIDPTTFDQREAKKDPQRSEQAPANNAGVKRVPHHATIYQVEKGGKLATVILPIEGYGLWSTLYGYLALDASDLNTIKGITFYEHGETPGLGGEVDNPRWKGLWPGRKAFDESGAVAIEVIKGTAGSPEETPHKVDGLSGATITSRGVSHLLQFWLGKDGFGPYLNRLKEGTA